MAQPTTEQQAVLDRFTMLTLATQTARDERDRAAYEAHEMGVSYKALRCGDR